MVYILASAEPCELNEKAIAIADTVKQMSKVSSQLKALIWKIDSEEETSSSDSKSSGLIASNTM